VAGEGFGETFQRLGGSPDQFNSARGYRERFFAAMLRGLVEGGILHRH
jgi:hypothetical protein